MLSLFCNERMNKWERNTLKITSFLALYVLVQAIAGHKLPTLG
jgi:hypothetical protein